MFDCFRNLNYSFTRNYKNYKDYPGSDVIALVLNFSKYKPNDQRHEIKRANGCSVLINSIRITFNINWFSRKNLMVKLMKLIEKLFL